MTGPDPILARKAGLTARLAVSASDIAAAQELRFAVFFEEGGASGSAESLALRRDADRFDALCDHLLLIEEETGRLAGTCRLLPQSRLASPEDFYTAGEFDIAPVITRHHGLRFVEIGRSCAAAEWRGKVAAELLFQAIWNYVRVNHFDVMFGCASLPGTEPHAIASELTLLAEVAACPPDWNAPARLARVDITGLAPAQGQDPRRTLARLPPLLKGYLRLGCYIGSDAVIDHAFGTTDVLVMLPVSRINPRYFAHYGGPE